MFFVLFNAVTDNSDMQLELLSVTALKRTKNIVANDDVEFAVAA